MLDASKPEGSGPFFTFTLPDSASHDRRSLHHDAKLPPRRYENGLGPSLFGASCSRLGVEKSSCIGTMVIRIIRTLSANPLAPVEDLCVARARADDPCRGWAVRHASPKTDVSYGYFGANVSANAGAESFGRRETRTNTDTRHGDASCSFSRLGGLVVSRKPFADGRCSGDQRHQEI